MKTLTIFTPAYNRAHTLVRTYESLCRQTCKDFEWLIVDDGSSDNTKEVVEEWIQQALIPIRYIYQENQGMHGAHNTAYHNINSKLNTCIDSDDWMPDDAVEKIIDFWNKNGDDKYAGFMGLDVDPQNNVIGTRFPEGLKECTLRGFYEDYNGKGDKKLVYRTDVINKYPDYPIFEGEKFVGLGSKYSLIDQDYNILVLNEPLVIVEYQQDGSSFGMWKQYWNNPNGFMYVRKLNMQLTNSWKKKFEQNVHFVSHAIRAKKWNFIQDSPMKLTTTICAPLGFLLYLVNWYKVRKNSNMNIK